MSVRSRLPLVLAMLLASSVRGSCYLMPAFEHEHIKWTTLGPFGLGDMEGTTYFYFGYHFQFSLHGTAATWMWLGPTMIVALASTLQFAARRYIRWRRALLASRTTHADTA